MKLGRVSYPPSLKEVTLTIPRGITYLSGSNGAGKSTLLDCLSGVNPAYEGTILGNESVVYFNQHLYFSPRLRARDFLDFICQLEGIRAYEQLFNAFLKTYDWVETYESIQNKQVGKLSGARDFLDFICQLEGIRAYEQLFNAFLKTYDWVETYESIQNKQVGKLSGGERRCFFFIVICFLEREWYLFDEPFAGVDEAGKKVMTNMMKALLRQGRNILLTSHEKEPLRDFEALNVIELTEGTLILKSVHKNHTD